MMTQPFSLLRAELGDECSIHFQSLSARLYDQHSQRFILGNDPVKTHLEGCYVLYRHDEPVARFAFYENPDLRYNNEACACFGSYECIADATAAMQVLTAVKALSMRKGYRYLLGPMEGSTWNNYRFSDHNVHRNFLGEPYHHAYYNEQFLKFGFVPIARYISQISTIQPVDNQRITELEEYYRKRGARIRTLNMENFRHELRLLAECSLTGFGSNFLYTPISVEDFVGKYEKIQRFLDSDFVLIAENAAGEIVAFVFALPDVCDPTGKTLIIKSIVNIPGSGMKGITSFLTYKILQLASSKGYTTLLHAFMLEDNISVNASKNFHGMPYKTYSLYGMKV